MSKRDIGAMKLARVYPALAAKVERKGRTREELDEVIHWLTGHDSVAIAAQLAADVDYGTFFAAAPRLHPRAGEIKGMICGHRVEDIADPLEQQVRWLDKLVDELAKGRPMDKIKRG